MVIEGVVEEEQVEQLVSQMSNNIPSTLDPHAGHDMSKQHSASNGHSDSGSHMMQMYFYASSEATVLFSCWTTSTWGGMLGSCIAVFVVLALYEGLKVFRERLLFSAQTRQRQYKEDRTVSTPNGDHPVEFVEPVARCSVSDMVNVEHLLQTLLHVFQVIVSYLLMLIFMTYNVWLCLSVAIGAGLGYFLFAWKRRRIYYPGVELTLNDHCH